MDLNCGFPGICGISLAPSDFCKATHFLWDMSAELSIKVGISATVLLSLAELQYNSPIPLPLGQNRA